MLLILRFVNTDFMLAVNTPLLPDDASWISDEIFLF